MNQDLTKFFSLYVHLPWCIRKCPYCDFNSYPSRNIPETDYFSTLIADFNQMMPYIENRQLKSIYFGGGTPSLFSAKFFAAFLGYVSNKFNINDIEISLEANPHTADSNKFLDYAKNGITRLSLGIQSFNDKHLTNIGRTYHKKEVFNAIEIVQKANFKSYSFDIIYGLPNQTANEAIDDLKKAIDFEPKHISWYQLTIEPNTVFARKKIPIPKDDTIETIEHEGLELLQNNGFSRYEISAYCKPGYECVHNINYWQYGDYIGIGAGSHSKITTKDNKIQRFTKSEDPKNYMTNSSPDYYTIKTITKNEVCFEFMLNSLRMLKPIKISLFEQQTKTKFEEFAHLFDNAVNRKLLHISNDSFGPTTLGKHFLNDLIAIFLPK